MGSMEPPLFIDPSYWRGSQPKQEEKATMIASIFDTQEISTLQNLLFAITLKIGLANVELDSNSQKPEEIIFKVKRNDPMDIDFEHLASMLRSGMPGFISAISTETVMTVTLEKPTQHNPKKMGNYI